MCVCVCVHGYYQIKIHPDLSVHSHTYAQTNVVKSSYVDWAYISWVCMQFGHHLWSIPYGGKIFPGFFIEQFGAFCLYCQTISIAKLYPKPAALHFHDSTAKEKKVPLSKNRHFLFISPNLIHTKFIHRTMLCLRWTLAVTTTDLHFVVGASHTLKVTAIFPAKDLRLFFVCVMFML